MTLMLCPSHTAVTRTATMSRAMTSTATASE
jgi:hypothetical protein